ncbi:hypothetical protein Enr13x_55820 [Stieleria neptunia]|uniref:Uncharacterized protein n=1 Tax=Stieleria neptunia TaxID=2527979 RepID=A0A518HXW6_9BACT|nr:hypothetical protein Enr13x_55820 [Stieleria neptunia]
MGIYTVRRCWIAATICSRTPVGHGDTAEISRVSPHRILTSKLFSGATTIAHHLLNRVFEFIRSAALITNKLGDLVIASSFRHVDSPSPPAPLPQTSLSSLQHIGILKSLGAHDQSESTKRLVRGRGEPFWGKSNLDLAVLGASPPVVPCVSEPKPDGSRAVVFVSRAPRKRPGTATLPEALRPAAHH